MISRRVPADFRETSKIPGPGSYDPNVKAKKMAPSYRIGSASRSELNRESLRVPGPGSY